MSKERKQNSIGFPPGLLGEAPVRMPVIGETEGWFALEKPAGVGVREYPWDSGVPDMDGALNKQLQAGKPELLRRGASLFGSAYYLDPDASGVAVFAKDRDCLSVLRNHAGSGDFQYRFLFVTRAGAAEGARELVADAPLLPHNTKPKMIPSTAKGKKTLTHFRQLSESNLGWALWEATTSLLRPHQVRCHAAVMEVPILGDVLYDGPVSPILRDLLPNKQGAGVRFPAYSGVALHLYSVSLAVGEVGVEPFKVCAELPRHYRVLLKRMQLSLPDGI